MLEMLSQVCFQAMGCDLAVAAAVQAGQLELNVMMPVVAFNLLFMIRILANAVREAAARSIDGITADAEHCQAYARSSLALATALSPLIGYAAAAEVARESERTGRSIVDVVRERGFLDARALDRILDPRAMTEPGIPALKGGPPAGPCRPVKRGARRGG
jgi:aspartate ammonia-lyase